MCFSFVCTGGPTRKRWRRGRKKEGRYRGLFSSLIAVLFDLCSSFALLCLILYTTHDRFKRHEETTCYTGYNRYNICDNLWGVVFSTSSLRLLSFFPPTIAAIIKSWELLKWTNNISHNTLPVWLGVKSNSLPTKTKDDGNCSNSL